MILMHRISIQVMALDRPPKHSDQRHDTDPRHASDQHSGLSDEPTRVGLVRPKKHADKRKHKVSSRYVSSSSEEDQSSVPRHRSFKPSNSHFDQDLPQLDPDPHFYREMSLADISSQYAKEVDILDLPNTRETMPRSSTSVLGLDDEKGRQELRPRGPSSMLPLSSIIKDAFENLHCKVV